MANAITPIFTLGKNTLLVGSGQKYRTIQAAITAAVAKGASATNPYQVLIMPGVYHENLVMATGVNLRGSSASAVIVDGYQTSADYTVERYTMLFSSGVHDITVEDLTIEQGLGWGYAVRLGDAAGEIDSTASAATTAVNPYYITFNGCEFIWVQGPAVIGYGHQVKWGNCKFEQTGLSGQDVCITDGGEYMTGSMPVFVTMAGAVVNTCQRGSEFYYRAHGTYGETMNVTDAGTTGDLAYMNMPYGGTGTVVTTGAGCNYLSFYFRTSISVAAGVLKIKIMPSLNGGGTALATVDVPATTAGAWYHFLIPVAGVASQAIGSIVINRSVATSAALIISLDEAWIQTGKFGLHEHTAYKCITACPTGGNAGTWLTWTGCLVLSRDYNSPNVRYSGESHSFAVFQSPYMLHNNAYAGNVYGHIIGCKFYTVTGGGTTGSPPIKESFVMAEPITYIGVSGSLAAFTDVNETSTRYWVAHPFMGLTGGTASAYGILRVASTVFESSGLDKGDNWSYDNACAGVYVGDIQQTVHPWITQVDGSAGSATADIISCTNTQGIKMIGRARVIGIGIRTLVSNWSSGNTVNAQVYVNGSSVFSAASPNPGADGEYSTYYDCRANYPRAIKSGDFWGIRLTATGLTMDNTIVTLYWNALP
jgi:hypothetical protein